MACISQFQSRPSSFVSRYAQVGSKCGHEVVTGLQNLITFTLESQHKGGIGTDHRGKFLLVPNTGTKYYVATIYIVHLPPSRQTFSMNSVRTYNVSSPHTHRIPISRTSCTVPFSYFFLKVKKPEVITPTKDVRTHYTPSLREVPLEVVFTGNSSSHLPK